MVAWWTSCVKLRDWGHEQDWGGSRVSLGGIFGLLLLVADVWAILNVFQSRESTAAKVVWTVLIIIMPLLGLIIWYFAGPRSSS